MVAKKYKCGKDSIGWLIDHADKGIKNPKLRPLLSKSKPGFVLNLKGLTLYTKDINVKQIMQNIKLLGNIDCFDLCDILRLELTGYVDTLNLHIMKDGSGTMIGCVCR